MNLSLKEKIGQLFMIGFFGTELPGETESFIKANNIGFVILFSRNIQTPVQAAALTNHIHSLAAIAPAIYTDQEGGLIVRFGETAATAISHMGLAATGNPRNARSTGRIIGREMAALGIDGVFAPVLDVNFEEDNPVIGIRSYSDDPAAVISFAGEFAAGLNEGGALACGKHYPGHGGTSSDSHLEIPGCTISPEYFFHYCWQPFQALAGSNIDSLMSAHVRFPYVAAEIATFSPYLIRELLRERAGYEGPVFSDCLEMRAVKDNHTVEEIAAGTMAAGIDVLSVSHQLDFQKSIFDRLLFDVQKGVIPEKRIDESLARILKLKEKSALLEKRKRVDPHRAGEILRSSIHLEREIAGQSITLLRNRGGLLPIRKESKCLILGWGKEEVSLLDEIGGHHLPQLQTRVLKIAEKLPHDVQKELADCDHIVACPYSLNPKKESGQAEAITQILRVRDDLVVAALGNPYDIRRYPTVAVYLVSYGARRVQLEALFQVLTGAIKPSGRLPVDIRGLFPRGSGLQL